MRKILILYAHPSPRRSEVNRPMARLARRLDGVTFVDLYSEYPTYDIDIDLEQARLREHDVLVFQHPLYWYSTPAILKEWQDLVLEYGFAYGEGGTALQGKIFLSAVTAAGHREAFTAKGANHHALRELLAPMEETALFCGMTYLAPFALYGARSAREQGLIAGHISAWRRLLEALRDDRLHLGAAAHAADLAAELDHLITET